jgi:hypothetical protein
MSVYDEGGREVRLGAEVARGGEARVVRLPDRPGEVAKLYLRSRQADRAKLDWMRLHPPDDPTRALGHASIAWPRNLLQDSTGAFVGYAMPFIAGAVPLVEVFNPRRRAAVLPDFDQRYLLRSARNLASSVDALHRGEYVIGDVNERNVLVTPRALVTVIDADSIQVQAEQRGRIVVYPCPVGRAEYTPPELQGKPFRGVMRLKEHDRFGLAVLLYQLLMDGNHPFRAQWLGAGECPPLARRIAEGWFPYGSGAPRHLAPPMGPSFDRLPPAVAALFLDCFVSGHASPNVRPTAAAWAHALAEAEARPTKPPIKPPAARPTDRWAGRQAGSAARTGIKQSTGAGRAAVAGARRSVERRLGSLPSATVLAMRLMGVLLSSRRRQALAAEWRSAKQRAAWVTGMAVLAVLAGSGLALVMALAVPPPGGTPVALTPTAQALASGMVGLVVASTFAEMAARPDRRIGRAAASSAAARAGLGVTGWLLGWTLAASMLAAAGDWSAGGVLAAAANDAVAGSPGPPPAGWTLAWAAYGAAASAVMGAGVPRAAQRVLAGAVFGAVGLGGVRLTVALLAMVRP